MKMIKLLFATLLFALPAKAQVKQITNNNVDTQHFDIPTPTSKLKINTSPSGALMQLLGAVAPQAVSSATAPASPVLGQRWYDTGAVSWKSWNGVAWLVDTNAATSTPTANSIVANMFAAGSEATTTVLGTVRYADNASTLAGTGNKVVTDTTLRNALGTGQSFTIDIAKNGYGAIYRSLDGSGDGHYSEVTGSGNGHGAVNVVSGAGIGHGAVNHVAGSGNGNGAYNQVTGTGNGNGAYNIVTGTGNGNGAYNIVTGSGNGHGAVNMVGHWQSTTGIASYSENGPLGLRDAVGAFNRAGTNTAWGITTNAGIFTAGGVTTSDKRVKENIVGINADNAIKLLNGIRFVQYDKLMDKRGIEKMKKAHNERGREGLKVAREKLEAHKGDEKERENIHAEIKRHEEEANAVFSTANKDIFVAKQAGVIAQELQDLTAKIGDFEWLVKLSDPHDKESILVVDYTSLEMILAFAGRENNARLVENNARLEARIAKLEGRK